MTLHEQTLDDVVDALRAFAIRSLAVSDEQLDAAIDTVDQAEAIGFVVDPTAYRKAMYSGSLDRQKAVLTIFRDTRQELAKVFKDVDAWLEAAASPSSAT